MPKIPSLSPKKVVGKLKKLEFYRQRQKGSHIIYINPKTNKRAVVPFHLKDIPKGTLSALLREAGISREEFLNA